MKTTTSVDGTEIAYESRGSGPLLVMVGGAFNDRNTWDALAQALSPSSTVASYDRRGRGDSGDTKPYAVEREIEDLSAVIKAASEHATASVYGVSSGGALALRAAATGAPINRLAVFEPPFRIAGAPSLPGDYADHLSELIEAGRNEDAVEYFQTAAVGLPSVMIEQLKATPAWSYLSGMAPTLLYDAYCLGGNDHRLPVDMLATIGVPTLAIASSGSPDWLRGTAAATADAITGASHVTLEGGFHEVPPEALAAALGAFSSPMTSPTGGRSAGRRG